MKLLTLTFLSLLSAGAATITLAPSPSAPRPGEMFTAEVRVTGVFDGLPGDELILFGFDVFVDDPTSVAYIGAIPGPLFDTAGLAGADVSGFPLDFSLAKGDFSEPLVLAVLTFERLNARAARIGIFADPDANPDHGLFFLGAVLPLEAAVSLSAVPEPSTLAMLAAATLALCVSRRFHSLR
jgi:hypothetical protein